MRKDAVGKKSMAMIGVMGSGKRIKPKRLAAIVIAIAMTFIIMPIANQNQVANAESKTISKAAQARETIPTRGTDVSTASAGNTMVSVKADFKYVSKTEILTEINRIRKEACDEGVKDPRNPSSHLTSSDYVPMTWSSALEWIAQTRAVEGDIYESHTRTNGKNWYTATHDGVSPNSENLAWNGSGSIMMGISQWYDEKADWVNQTSGAVTGHYTSLINPSYVSIGIGACGSMNNSNWGTVAGEFSTAAATNQAQEGVQGTYNQKIEVQQSALTTSISDSSKMVHLNAADQLTLNSKLSYNGLGSSAPIVYTPVSLATQTTWNSNNKGTVSVTANSEDSSMATVTAILEGSATITATNNGKNYTAVITAAKHLYATTIVPATMTADGSITKKCSVCGNTEKRVIPKASRVKINTGTYVYDGKTKIPTVTVMAGSIKLKSGQDYKLTYSAGGKDPGKYKVVVTFKGNYKGSKTFTYTILPKATTMSKVVKGKKSFTAQWKKQATKTTGYQIQYGVKSSFKGAKTKTIAKTKTTKLTVKKLKAKKKYYVRVRTYKTASGMKYYSAWSKVKTVKTK